MQSLHRLINTLGTTHRKNPLNHWLGSDGESPEQKLWFGLFACGFIMQFRDLNYYHTTYGDGPDLDRQRRALSAHAAEDMTHSPLFLQDAATLSWGSLTGWRPSQVLHWLFTNPATEGDRALTARLSRLMVLADDPLIRFCAVEAIESTGHCCFRRTVLSARKYTAATDRELRYWGDYHLQRESGHAVTADEAAFDDLTVSKQQRAAATRAVVDTFALFEQRNNELFRDTQQAISLGGFDYFGSLPLDASPQASEHELGLQSILEPGPWHPTQQPIADSLAKARAAISHALDDVTRATQEGACHPIGLLRRGLLISILDDLNWPSHSRYLLPYTDSAYTPERAINRLASRLLAATPCYDTDWITLAMDDRVPQPLERTLEYVYFADLTEPSHSFLRIRAQTRSYSQTSQRTLRQCTPPRAPSTR